MEDQDTKAESTGSRSGEWHSFTKSGGLDDEDLKKVSENVVDLEKMERLAEYAGVQVAFMFASIEEQIDAKVVLLCHFRGGKVWPTPAQADEAFRLGIAAPDISAEAVEAHWAPVIERARRAHSRFLRVTGITIADVCHTMNIPMEDFRGVISSKIESRNAQIEGMEGCTPGTPA